MYCVIHLRTLKLVVVGNIFQSNNLVRVLLKPTIWRNIDLIISFFSLLYQTFISVAETHKIL